MNTTLRTFALFSLCAMTVMVASRVNADAAESDAETKSPARTPVELCVATFNLRYASPDGPNSWPERRPVMRECWRQISPDIVGTQEGLPAQLRDLAKDLPDYAWVGTGRDGNNKGESMAIFYRRDRFMPLATNHFWLSDTPEVVASSTWGNVCRRMVTWVKFRDLPSGREFYFWNTHLDHEVALAREKGAELIGNRITGLPSDIPLILTGDFNCAGGDSRPYDILTKDSGLSDSWTMAGKRINETYNSFQGFHKPQKAGNRIDWILTRGKVEVDKTEIVTFARDGQFPSDHFPVVAWIKLP